MFILKSNKVPTIISAGARECLVVNITHPERINGITGLITVYRYKDIDAAPASKGWRTADGFNLYTADSNLSTGAIVANNSGVNESREVGRIVSYSGYVPNIAGMSMLSGHDRGIVLLRQRPVATEHRVRVPNTSIVHLRPSMDHDLKDGNSRQGSKYINGCLIIQSLYRGKVDHFTTYEQAETTWADVQGDANATTLDTSCFITSDYYSSVLLDQSDYIWVKITGEIYLDIPGDWEIWDYRDDCSACDFGGSIGGIYESTSAWSRRVTYTSTGDEWVPFTWYFAEGTLNDYWAIHIKGPNDSSHRVISQDQIRYTQSQWNACNVPEAPQLVFRLPLDKAMTTATTGQLMTTVGSPVYETVDGRSGVRLDGSSYIYTTDTTGAPSGRSGRVICAWIRADTGQRDQYFMCYGNGNINQRYGFGITAASSQKFATFRGGYEVLHNFVPAYNKWYHVMLVFQGSQEKLFVDGELIDTIEHTNVDTQPEEICIGTGASSHNASLVGYVSDVRIYNGASGLQDIKKIYKDCMKSS